MSAYFEKLQALQKNAYAPYSKFQVASILVLENGTEVAGVNVENASFGGTICAERSAFVSAVSQHGDQRDYKEIHLLAGSATYFAMPCGLCRQFMHELVKGDFAIYSYLATGERRRITMAELLPHAFSGDDIR